MNDNEDTKGPESETGGSRNQGRGSDSETPRSAFPASPDLTKVRDLRTKMRRERAAGARARRATTTRGETLGRRARDIGSYTIIPMLMLAGPAVGYIMGLGVEKLVGGAPWPGVVGLLFGLAAGFRQVFLLLKRRSEEEQRDAD